MYSKNLIDFSEINFKSGVPKYKQLIFKKSWTN